MSPHDRESMIRQALWHAEMGYSILSLWGTLGEGRCRCREGASCASPGKHPIEKFAEATHDPDVIRVRLDKASLPNYGLLLRGHEFAIDVDGAAVAEMKERAQRLGLWVTKITRTANGYHLFGFWPESVPQPTGNLFGLVTRWGDANKMVVGPGSLHHTGFVYRSAKAQDDLPIPTTEMPKAWVDEALASGAAPAAIRDRVAGGRQITAGGRHDALRDLARTLVGLGFTGEPLYLAVLDWNAAHCDPPKAASDVRKAIGEVEAKFEMDPPPIRLRAPRADLRWRK